MSGTPGAAQALVRLLIDVIRDAGWANTRDTALVVAAALLNDIDVLADGARFQAVVPTEFTDDNGVTAELLRVRVMEMEDRVAELAHQGALLAVEPLIQIDAIDSFARVSEVSAQVVAGWVSPLDMLEDDIERMIAQITGQPYRQKDWGGELDDMFTGQVKLKGQNVATSFLLKGRSVQGVMKPKDLGHNGDQITRMLTQPASLFVVQHVHRVDPSVRLQLRTAVIAKRAEGHACVGSIWEGVDIGRLGVAYGFLSRDDGSLIPGALTIA